jgi:MFS family permease
MSQLAINLGILLAQTCGLIFSDYGDWRYIFAVGAGLAAINAILILATPESPEWLVTAGHLHAGHRCLEYLRDSTKVDHEFESYITKPQRGTEAETLLTITECSPNNDNNGDFDPEATHAPANCLPCHHTKPISIWSFFTARKFRRQLVAVVGLMAFQQICGVNSIVFYSVRVLAGLIPRLAPALNCIISIITCLIVIASASIVDKHC